MEHRIDIKGQRANIGGLEGVYTKLLWDLRATEATGGEAALPPPVAELFISAAGVSTAQKLQWLESCYPDGWLESEKAALADRLAYPVVTAEILPDTILL